MSLFGPGDSVTMTVNGQPKTVSFTALTQALTANACSATGCASDVASAATLDHFWLVFGGCMVFFMILGFALLEIGCVHAKNTKHILMRNLGDLCITGLTFYAVGYAFLFGEGNVFIGYRGFFLQGDEFDTAAARGYPGLPYALWFYEWAIASVCVTIFSGAVAERIALGAYFSYTLLVGAFVYPVAGHWIWSTTGWASVLNTENLLFGVGAIDFAGCGCIHMVGGASALVGCLALGPRKGRFHTDGTHSELPKQSVLYQSLGTLVLWFGWYGFNCVSTLTLRGDLGAVMAKVAVNLTLAACTGGLCTVLLDRFTGSKTFDVCMGNNGILAGCVSVTGSCSVIEPEGAVALGAIASLVYLGLAKLVVRCRVDDVVDAVPVHLGCGTLGALAPGFFASSKGVAMAVGTGSCGVFYRCNGNQGNQLAAQVVYVLAVFVWITGFCALLFGLLNKLGVLRCTPEAEAKGMDIYEHGGPAYDIGQPTSRVAVAHEEANATSHPVDNTRT
ncbi:ammonium transporter channel family [Achlya hypogyna]|uniref:Ammonium transporter n=1 Tax=Achlya hypogyna TaxID=1202772 RepID=A0A1V9YCD4_ACHHY|nr:ammonium transporter channel family [Achlya hypogyna]